jgi:ankyrin repeat protein
MQLHATHGIDSTPPVSKVLAVDPNLCHYKDRIGQSMLHLAAMFNNAEICTMLVEKGGNLEETNSQGESVLDVASVSLAMKLKAMQVK